MGMQVEQQQAEQARQLDIARKQEMLRMQRMQLQQQQMQQQQPQQVATPPSPDLTTQRPTALSAACPAPPPLTKQANSACIQPEVPPRSIWASPTGIPPPSLGDLGKHALAVVD